MMVGRPASRGPRVARCNYHAPVRDMRFLHEAQIEEHHATSSPLEASATGDMVVNETGGWF